MMIRSALPLLSLMPMLLPGAIPAQDWYREDLTSSPLARRFHILAHLGDRTLLFGGVDERQGIVFGDTWSYDGVRWTQLPVSGPGARQRGSACVDTVRGVVLLFGGADASGQALGDTWQFDGTGWQQLAPGNGPSPRQSAAMAFDAPRGRAVLFGGAAPGQAPDDETWEFDGATWSRRSVANAPTARQGHVMTHDPVRGRTILFGGLAAGSTSFNSETWEWDGADWNRIATPTLPSAALFPAMTFFDAHGVAVLTGGTGAASQRPATWAFDGTDWHPGPAAPAGFTGRQGHAIAYDAAREMVVLFGGASIGAGGARPLDDTWELSTRAAFEPFGAGCSPGSAGPVLSARASARPQLGTELVLDIAPAGTLALLAVGLSDTSHQGTPLPLPLAAFGLPGCELLVSVDHVVPTAGTGGIASATIGIPLRRELIGQVFFAQALVLQAGGPGGAMSNGARATVGN